jgi:porphobilinogen synthase
MKIRPRRLRVSDPLRQLVRETVVNVNDLIYPLFVKQGEGIKEEIASMPGQFRFSVDTLKAEVAEASELGIKSVLLFGLATHKDEHATEAFADTGAVQQAIRMIKKEFPQIVVMTDVCVCGYTTHGHCGIVRNNYVQNDESLKLLAKMAVSHAHAGSDIVAPSAMMDGQVKAIRKALDEARFYETGIMAYSAKYFSAFYGPFRDAADSSPQFGNRATYQMDPGNSREAIREMETDVREGADIIMVKPALSYLDIIRIGKDRFNIPMAAYNVSGEYSLIKAGAEKGWINEEAAVMEMILSMKRAGADLIITYFAKDVARNFQ